MSNENPNNLSHLPESLSVNQLAEQAAALPKHELEEFIRLTKVLRTINPNPVIEEVQGEFTEYDPNIIDIEVNDVERTSQITETNIVNIPSLVDLSEYEMSEVVADLSIQNEGLAINEIETLQQEKLELIVKLESILETRKNILKARNTIFEAIEISKSSDPKFTISQTTENQINKFSDTIYQLDIETIQLIKRIEFLSLEFGQITNKQNQNKFKIYHAVEKTVNYKYIKTMVDILEEDVNRERSNISSRINNTPKISPEPIFDYELSLENDFTTKREIVKVISRNRNTTLETIERLLTDQDFNYHKTMAESQKVKFIEIILENYHLFERQEDEQKGGKYWDRIIPIIKVLMSKINESSIRELHQSVRERIKAKEDVSSATKYLDYGYRQGELTPKKSIRARISGLFSLSDETLEPLEEYRRDANRPNFPSR